MHHVLSLRPGRPETAASVENPAAPPSIAKARRFLNDNIGHAIRKSTGGALAPELAKKLAQLIAMEKNLLRSMESVSKERIDSAQKLSAWGEEQDEDISDVTDKLSLLLFEVGDLEDVLVDRHDQFRLGLKDIRNIEKSVQPIRDRKQKIQDQLAQLRSKENSDVAEIEALEHESVRVDAESLVAEIQLSNITHEKIKSAFVYQFEAMREYGEKLSIIAGYGKHLMDLVDDKPLVPGEVRSTYTAHETSEGIVKDCDHALTTWVGSNAAVSTKLSERTQSKKEERDTPQEHKRRWSSDSESGRIEGAPSGQKVAVAI